MVGPRLGRWDMVGEPAMGSPTNAIIGLFMLWWGWLAFNSGSSFGQLNECVTWKVEGIFNSD
jgi:ammonia channel protein AmtB